MSVTGPPGFVSSGVACGIKDSGELDLALVATDDCAAVPAAGVFTENLAPAAPVVLSRRHLAQSDGRAAAVVLSSGNANAATGRRGIDDAKRICEQVAGRLGASPSEVLLCQTGLIGIPLPIDRLVGGLGDLVTARGPSRDHASSAAQAIMTTDTVAKEAVAEGAGYLVGGMAKGAAMLAPNMATMLAVLTTDARCEHPVLQKALARAVDRTFNRMTVDGCTSTNDSVLVLANGRSRVQPSGEEIASVLETVCGELATMMAADAEGATKLARVEVRGAASEEDALRAARKVAQSTLVKCSLNGADPYWGRVVSELGSAGAAFDPDKVSVSYGGVTVCRDGTAVPHDQSALAEHMAQRTVEITCDLGLGADTATIVTCDLGHGYIDENRTTS